MSVCYIICALKSKIDFKKGKNDFVIAADRGYFHCVNNNIKPDVVIGDFDSYNGEIDCDNIIRYPVKKDYTDSKLAVEYAILKGYSTIHIYGAIGGHLDHTLANISLLAEYIKKNVKIVLFDGDEVIFAISNSSVSFDKDAKGKVSVFSYGVCESGLLYTLDNYTLNNSFALGVSNEFIGQNAKVSVKEGILLIHTPKENYLNHLT